MKKILLFLALSLYLFSYEKVALVIGNRDYAIGSLTNTVIDAQKIGEFLDKKGFKVFIRPNLTYSSMKREIRRAKKHLSKDGVFLVYFSGHGVEIEGENYLMPIDNSNIYDEIDVTDRGISLNYIIRHAKRSSSRINIIMVDACRNNPYSFSKGNKGLGVVSVDKLRGTFLTFAGATKQTIPDDGLFRKMFIKYANQPLSLGDLFTNIRREFEKRGRNGVYTNSRATNIFKFTQTKYIAPIPYIQPTAQKYSITINPTPSNAKVYIMNIVPRYRDGIILKKYKDYDIKVELSGYKTQRFNLYLDKDISKNIVLEKNKKTTTSRYITKIGNLMWQDQPYTSREQKAYNADTNYGKAGNWNYAKRYCRNLSLGGYSNWRLPSKSELKTLVTKNSKSNSKGKSFYIKKEFLENMPNSYASFWTSISKDSTQAWVVYFSNGNVYWYYKTFSYFVRCVR